MNGNYADNSPGNLHIVSDCHALSPTFKALNKGNGPPWAIMRRLP